jgi:hypothetical protein
VAKCCIANGQQQILPDVDTSSAATFQPFRWVSLPARII